MTAPVEEASADTGQMDTLVCAAGGVVGQVNQIGLARPLAHELGPHRNRLIICC